MSQKSSTDTLSSANKTARTSFLSHSRESRIADRGECKNDNDIGDREISVEDGNGVLDQAQSTSARPTIAPKPRFLQMDLQNRRSEYVSRAQFYVNVDEKNYVNLPSTSSATSQELMENCSNVEEFNVEATEGPMILVRDAIAHYNKMISNNSTNQTLRSNSNQKTLRSAMRCWHKSSDQNGGHCSFCTTHLEKCAEISFIDYSAEFHNKNILTDNSIPNFDSIRTELKQSLFGRKSLRLSAESGLKSCEFTRSDRLRKSEGSVQLECALSSNTNNHLRIQRFQGRMSSSDSLSSSENSVNLVNSPLYTKSNSSNIGSNFSCETAIDENDYSVLHITSFDSTSSNINYCDEDIEEEKRLRKLHYAAREIYTVEAKFVGQLELLAEHYPKYLVDYGKKRGIDLLTAQPCGQSHVIQQIAVQLLMIKEAHKILLESFAAKMSNWNSREPNFAKCLRNGAPFLKYCLPYLKEKKKFAHELQKELQENARLSNATNDFEENFPMKISVVQQLDIVHQNVVRYTILLEAYKKYLLPSSSELKECEGAIEELVKVTGLVDHQISLAEMEKSLINIYCRLEGRFNVFEANRHLLFEGELMKQSRKDLQPRYLILFSDALLVCKYSRAPNLVSDSAFQPDFYQFNVARIRVEAEEHGEFDTHFQLLTTEKSAVFVAKTKRDRDEWVKRINAAKQDAKNARRPSHNRNASDHRIIDGDFKSVENNKNKVKKKSSENSGTLSEYIPANNKYVALWTPDPKATSCMMSGCRTKFNIINRRHHCRECGWVLFLAFLRGWLHLWPVQLF